MVSAFLLLGWANCGPYRPPTFERTPTVTYSPAELCRSRQPAGTPVLVFFRIPPVPTADPRVWEYRPGQPAKLYAPTVRLTFAEPVHAPPREVRGVTAGRTIDFLERTSRAPGVMELAGCTPVSHFPP